MEVGAVGLLGPVVEVTVEGQKLEIATIRFQHMGELTVWGQVLISIHVLEIAVKVRFEFLPFPLDKVEIFKTLELMVDGVVGHLCQLVVVTVQDPEQGLVQSLVHQMEDCHVGDPT